MKRRRFLRRAGVAGAAAAGIGTLGGASAAVEHDAKPSHVTLEYDESWLRTYRPAFRTDYQTMQASDAVYAYKATSSEYEYDIACYWHRLSHQEGSGLVGVDTHLYDHEPVYVLVDADGTPAEAVYAYYHHFASVVEQPPLDDLLVASETDMPTHVALAIAPEWHNYTAAPDEALADLTLDYGFADWTAAVETWQDRGVFEKTAAEAVYDPATMRTRESWWDHSTFDYQLARIWHDLAQRFAWAPGGNPTTYP